MKKVLSIFDYVTEKSYEIYPGHFYSIGRHPDCNIQTHPDSKEISRKHANIEFTKEGLIFLVDNSSTNGTFILENGNFSRIYKDQIYEGQEFYLGISYKLKLCKKDLESELKKQKKSRLDDTEVEIESKF